MIMFIRACAAMLLLVFTVGVNASTEKEADSMKKLKVTATAYNSLPAQTDSTPDIAAWGDRLRPGMKAIAVSRDLLKKYGLKHKDKVKISGLEGEYQVLDKMNKRWKKKIDIYMGKDRRKALKWGRKDVTIHW
jgi:3D (Asp-Asp-Asp) domain-containing protein